MIFLLGCIPGDWKCPVGEIGWNGQKVAAEWATAGENGQPLPLFCYTIGFLAFFSIFISWLKRRLRYFFNLRFAPWLGKIFLVYTGMFRDQEIIRQTQMKKEKGEFLLLMTNGVGILRMILMNNNTLDVSIATCAETDRALFPMCA